MPNLPEDRPQDRGEGNTPGVVPDWVEGARITGRPATAYRDINEGQGSALNALLAREISKEATLRARLQELGIERDRTNNVFVHGKADGKDVALIPWDIIFDLFNRDRGKVGAMGAKR
jgi:hypothetical protein